MLLTLPAVVPVALTGALTGATTAGDCCAADVWLAVWALALAAGAVGFDADITLEEPAAGVVAEVGAPAEEAVVLATPAVVAPVVAALLWLVWLDAAAGLFASVAAEPEALDCGATDDVAPPAL
jgi:hypothetical protein